MGDGEERLSEYHHHNAAPDSTIQVSVKSLKIFSLKNKSAFESFKHGESEC